MRRVTLDANVLAPGFTSVHGASRRLIERWEADDYELVISEHLLAELRRAFDDPYYRTRVSSQQVDRILALLHAQALQTAQFVPVVGVATHPEDDLILSTALSGGASVLCTRDKQLLRLREHQTVAILSPGELLALLEREVQSG